MNYRCRRRLDDPFLTGFYHLSLPWAMSLVVATRLKKHSDAALTGYGDCGGDAVPEQVEPGGDLPDHRQGQLG